MVRRLGGRAGGWSGGLVLGPLGGRVVGRLGGRAFGWLGAGVYIIPSNLISFRDIFSLKLGKINIFRGGSIITKHFYCRFVSQYLRNHVKYTSSCS